MRAIFFAVALIGSVTASSAFAAPPANLRGKSIVVSWTEERQQKIIGEETMRNVTRSGEFSVYISDQGRPFSRMKYTFSNNRGASRTGNRDKVGGGGNRTVSFSGNTMNVTMRVGDGGARNLVANLSGDSCSAQVIAGKEQGASRIRAKSMVTGAELEIVSMKTGAASCSIRNGNVFGD